MKNIVYLNVLMLCLLWHNSSNAQITFTPSASYLKATGNNKASMVGAGLQVTYNILKNLEGGIKFNYYPAKNSHNEIGSGFNTTLKDKASNLVTTYSYFLKPSSNLYRPYIGLDAGFNFAKQEIVFNDIFTGVNKSSQNVTNVLVSPTVGTRFKFSKHIGLFVQGQYHFSLQKTKEKFIGYTALGNAIVISPIQRFFSIDAGLTLSL